MSSHQLFLFVGEEAFSCTVIYTSGSGTEIAPTGAGFCTIYGLAAGGGGNRNSTLATARGGGGGAYGFMSGNVAAGDGCSYVVGAQGTGRLSTSGSGTNGGNTSVAITANGGFSDMINNLIITHMGLKGGDGAQTTTNGAGGIVIDTWTGIGGTRPSGWTDGNAGTAGDGDLGGKGGDPGGGGTYAGVGGNNSPSFGTIGVAGTNYGAGGGGGANANGSNGSSGIVVFVYS